MFDPKFVSAQEVSQHNNPADCWIVVDDLVWDVTDFLEEHPGGSASEGHTSSAVRFVSY